MNQTQTDLPLQIKKSNSSYGNYSVRISSTEIKYFMRKKEAEDFVLSQLDLKYTREIKTQNELPVFINSIYGIKERNS